MPAGRRRFSVPLVVLVLVAGVMGACGDDDEEEGGGTTTTSSAPAPGGSARVDIEMRDYAYTVSGPLIEGGTISVRNTGNEMHMLGMAKLKPGAGVADIIAAVSESGPGSGEGGEPEGEEGGEGTTTTTGRGGTTTSAAGGGATTSTTSATGAGGTGGGEGTGDRGQEPEVGDEEGEEDPTAQFIEAEVGMPGNLLLPGGAAEITVPKLAGPGRYVLACFIPTEGEGAPHIVKGMASELEVTGGTAPTPTADATYRATAGEPIEGPATLTPGKKVLKIEATGAGAAELEPALAKPRANTSLQDIADAFERVFGDDVPVPPRGAGRGIPVDGFVNVFDFQQADTVYLGVDLTPGTWELVSSDTDAEDAPDVPVERITIRVQ